MKRSLSLISCFTLSAALGLAQPADKRSKYDIEKEKVLYTIGYTHLDSQWCWDYKHTIDVCLKNTLTENFYLLEKYPDYVFNFTGSRRYHLMKEYYPDMYERLGDYIRAGRWHVSGSSVDEGDVNAVNSESLIRQVLYGNEYFRKEFGVRSWDYMLPDCFGFRANAPSAWAHAGLLGFSTQKLTWGSAVGIPFNVGVYNGPDGKGVIAAFNATDYAGEVYPRLDLNEGWERRLDRNNEKYGLLFDYRYYGLGDQGGGPRENCVRHAVNSLNNPDSKFRVVLTSSDQMYKDISPELRAKLPAYSGDLLLHHHSAGSITSQSFMKRMNRKNENMAQAAEQAATLAKTYANLEYPVEKLNNSWELLLGTQMHDILPGTSIPKAYEYSWNDEFVAANGFAEVLKNSLGHISSQMNTVVQGRSFVVYNPVALAREDVVEGEIVFAAMPENIKVFDGKGKEVPSQIISRDGNKLKFVFLANVPSVGFAVYDVREAAAGKPASGELKVTGNTLENKYYKVVVDANGDFSSIYDKLQKRELLASPARLEFQFEAPVQYPAWNMDWKDRKEPPVGFMNGDVKIKVTENGPVRIALEIERSGKGSAIRQMVSLAAGDPGKRVEVNNKINWKSQEVSLKAAFPLTAGNDVATYNLGVGTIQRDNNREMEYEVPHEEWFDLTDKSGKYGVSIMEDCKYGSDKPDDNTVRLTLMYTPKDISNHPTYRPQDSQDWGIHDFKYGVYSHAGDWSKSEVSRQAEFLNKPLIAFEAPKHEGRLGKSVSWLDINSPGVGLMALKKAERDNDYYIVRVNELTGKDLANIKLAFPVNITDAYEVDGQEYRIGDAKIDKGSLVFDLSHYTIRSFAVKLASVSDAKLVQAAVELPYNKDLYTNDHNRVDGIFDRDRSYPAELIPETLTSEGIRFEMGSIEDEQMNSIICRGQTIDLPAGKYNKIYFLAAANEDTDGKFIVGDNETVFNIGRWTGFIGQHYNRHFAEDFKTVTKIDSPYYRDDNVAFFSTHCHIWLPSSNEAYAYSYMYKYEIDLPEGVTKLTLPDNEKIKIMAMTVADQTADDIILSKPLVDDFANDGKYERN